MSGIGEAVGIIACVAAVISAYRDGGAIVEKIKAKRKAKRAVQPTRLLEEAISNAPQEIERESSRGVKRFGRTFEQGDHIAVIALQQITIQLQRSLLEKLREAAYDDDVIDFTYLVDAADVGRNQTMATLLAFSDRLMQAAPITGIPPSSDSLGASRQQMRTNTWAPSNVGLPSRNMVVPSYGSPTASQLEFGHRSTPTRASTFAHDSALSVASATSGAEDPSPSSQQTKKGRHLFLLGPFRHPRNRSSGSVGELTSDLETQGDCPPIPHPRSRRKSSRSAEMEAGMSKSPSSIDDKPAYIYEEGEDNPFEIWGSHNKKTSDGQQRSITTSVNPSRKSSSATSATMMRTLSNAPSVAWTQNTQASISVPKPTSDNSYLGFCKGAWRLQCGDKNALEKCRDFRYSAQAHVYYYRCSKCNFEGHHNLETIWQKVWDAESKGIRLRWAFLAKSHVPQKQVRDDKYSYQCMFCVFLGRTTPVMHGMALYLDHINQEHRGRGINEIVLDKTACVNNRICEESEEFDINLFPLTIEEQSALRRQSHVLDDELMGGWVQTSTSNVSDSVYSNEPWNVGLSDFHISDERELGGSNRGQME